MAKVPSRVASRIVSGLKRYQPILASAQTRDVNESDTVTIVADVLHDVFGYDKYADITSEHAIRGTFCDLAIRIDGELVMLVEVKAINLELKHQFVKQAVDYAANQGVDWVFLTNGNEWHVYKLTFGKPIDSELVTKVNLLAVNPKDEEHIEQLYLLSKEGWQRSALADHHARCQAFNRFTLAALITSDPVLGLLRKELRRSNTGLKVDNPEIETMLLNEVLKRDVVEGDKAIAAKRAVAKSTRRAGAKMTVVPQQNPFSAEPVVRLEATGARPCVESAGAPEE